MTTNGTKPPPEKTKAKDAPKKAQLPQRVMPAHPIEKALLIPRAIVDEFGGRGGEPTSIALAIQWAPTGGSWRALTSTAMAYGLTEGGYNANEIVLTPLGSQIVKPTEERADKEALIKAILMPTAIKAFAERYNKNKYPSKEIAINVLEGFGVPRERASAAFDIITENFKYIRALRTTANGQILLIDPNAVATATRASALEVEPTEFPPRGSQAGQIPAEPPPAPPPTPHAKKQFFVAHGTDQQALEQLESMLRELNIPFTVAKNEAHAGRPISEKVAQLMQESSGGFFIFSGDERVQVGEDKSELRPRMNIVFELGAASLLYGKRIVIFKEDGVVFPSDFSDLGYIPYAKGDLKTKSLELLKELIKLGAVQLLPGT